MPLALWLVSYSVFASESVCDVNDDQRLCTIECMVYCVDVHTNRPLGHLASDMCAVAVSSYTCAADSCW
jgi:hypothetical protein